MIYVITHKTFDETIVPGDEYRILHVGLNDSCRDNYLRDDTGENISFKNPNYCELTGLYWIWKNGEEGPDDLTGLVHYRRFFTKQKELTRFNRRPAVLMLQDVKDCFETKHTIILPKAVRTQYTLETAYAINHDIRDLRIVREIIREDCPDYLDSFDNVMHGRVFCGYNMFICKKRDLDSYCRWLFPLLKKLELSVGEMNREAYQARIYGFISERLLQVWVLQNRYHVIYFPVFNTEKKPETVLVRSLKDLKAYKLKINRIIKENILDENNKKYHI